MTCRRRLLGIATATAVLFSSIHQDEVQRRDLGERPSRMKEDGTEAEERRRGLQSGLLLPRGDGGHISALKGMFGHKMALRKRHNQNLEMLCMLVLWNYWRVSMA